MIKLFLDTEFTGLKKDTELISIGIVSDTGDTFYAEMNIETSMIQDEWIKENVLNNLIYQDRTHRFCKMQGGLGGTPLTLSMKGNKENVKSELLNFLHILSVKYKMHGEDEDFEVWSDCLAYDWVLFCDLFGTAFDIPAKIYYIPFDICTVFRMKGIDPDCNRIEFSELENIKSHNALDDARVIKACYERLMRP